MQINIRQELEKDFDKVESLIKEAFLNAEHTDNNEHILVKNLRKSEAFIPQLSLVAIVNDNIVGHILFTKIKINNTTQLALAPLAVLPKYQKMGIGKKLIESGHKIAREMCYDFSVVLGHSNYYPKFGYKEAKIFGIKAPFEVSSENFMAIKLNDNNVNVSGIVEYAKEFFE